jgi:hypothetical protein
MSFVRKSDSKDENHNGNVNHNNERSKPTQKEAMRKLASSYKKKSSERRQSDSWQVLLNNILDSQRGKLPLLLAVEAGNQSMVRELLSSQTAEQLKVRLKTYIFYSFFLYLKKPIC